jgi:hypothetical protein
MPQVTFEHTIPVFERTKTVLALDRAATVIGYCLADCPSHLSHWRMSYARFESGKTL